MKYCDLTFPSPQENLACDEALLDLAEQVGNGEVLRIWEPAQYFVVVGYGNEISKEVDAASCKQNNIPILRRCTGGGTVLQGPGVLNYSLILQVEAAEALGSIAGANRYIMERHRSALGDLLGSPVEVCGHTDLAIGGLKFSGNAQRRKKRWLLFHGSFLLDLDLGLIQKVLPMPSKQPDYRRGRRHSEFLMNLKVEVGTMKEALLKVWEAEEPFEEMPFTRVQTLARDKYGRDDWNSRF
jgi:lipoate-protein ligase A